MDDSFNELIYFSGVATSRDNNGGRYHVPASWGVLPSTLRDGIIPLVLGVKGFHPAHAQTIYKSTAVEIDRQL